MRFLAAIAMFLFLAAMTVSAQPSRFTYQGSLKTTGQPANGNFDMQFDLYFTVSGNTSSATRTVLNVAVVNGLFNVILDFGYSEFAGPTRYLEVSVRPAGSGTYTPLGPRTEFTAAPFAIQSVNSVNAANSTNAQFLGGRSSTEFTLTTDPRLSDARSPLANSPNYIQNGSAVQSNSSFNVSGNGTVGGTLTANSINTPSQYLINGQNALLMNANNLLVGSAPIFAEPSTGNTIIGLSAGNNLFGGNSNTYTGKDAGKNFISGSQNSFFGSGSGRDANNGDYNTFIGSETGNGNSSGAAGQTMIGAFADVRVQGISNATAIGFRAAVDQSNSLVLGSSNGVNGATADTNVGIGTSSPSARLELVGRMRIQQKLNATGSFETAGIWFYQRTPNADRAFIGMQDDGKVGFYGSNGGGWGFAMNTATGTSIVNALGSAGSTALCRNASNEISTCSSSARYKDNVRPFVSGLDLIRRLRPVSFNWKNGGMLDMGLVAEEVNKVEPLLTTTNSRGEIEGVKYDRVGVVLINAVKEQQILLDEQGRKLETQENRIEQLKEQVRLLTNVICSTQKDLHICKEQK